MRVAVLAMVLAAVACGSRVESGRTADDLVAIERDPQLVLTAASHPTYKATYEMTFGSVSQAQSATPTVALRATQTVVSRPPDFRWDFDYSGASSLRASAIVRGQSAWLCADTPAPAACYTVPADYAQQALSQMNASPLDQVRAATKDMDVTVLPRERIAGTDAACFRWQPQSTFATAAPGRLVEVAFEGCFTGDGIPLRTLVLAGMFFRMEQRATTFTSAVTDGDVALPYAVSSQPYPLPSLPVPSPSTPRP